jgi:hypothetical protein
VQDEDTSSNDETGVVTPDEDVPSEDTDSGSTEEPTDPPNDPLPDPPGNSGGRGKNK